MNDEPDKVELDTPDLAAASRAVIEALLPGAIRDHVLDAAYLAELLDIPLMNAPDGRERYGLQWAGKSDAIRSLLAPGRGSLVPDLRESVDFDHAQNVFIEGDNLEVLKLLQKAYNDEVKLIYIDPPYNTGNDFVYSDDFADGLRGYLSFTGQLDESGNRTTATSDRAGRTHSRWLSMMYPRLVLARNLLTHDGVLFVSIDDNEFSNLKAVLDEVFGPENALGCITVVSNLKGRSDDKYFATAHNYLLAYQRSSFFPRGVPLPDAYRDDYPETDGEGKRFRLQGLRKRGNSAHREDRPSMYYPFYVDPASGGVALEQGGSFMIEVVPRLSDGKDGRWRWGLETARSRINELMARQVGPARRWDVFQIDALERDGVERRVIPKTVWDGPDFANEAGTLELRKLMGKRVFDTPKPTGLIRQILEHTVSDDDLILDFFAGSGSTAHAVALMNAEDGGTRRVISVNIQEPTAETSDARRLGYKTVSEITLDRLKTVLEVVPGAKQQGLRVYRLDGSAFKDAVPDDGEIMLHSSTLRDGLDDLPGVVAELLLKEGVPLDAPWVGHELGEVYTEVSGGVAVVVGEGLDFATAEKVFGLDPKPRVVVFLEDDLAGQDALKANLVANAKSRGIKVKTV
ncbi:site-specific DNA-methyltransferase [Demequina aurantiaca]|uniref:site-specific DNA-methyltransferase n=1 Tax=Demequina aurantiaca TaxID=676200 RepID=UPI003D3578D6